MATLEEIGEVFGVGRSSVSRWPIDPNDLRSVLIYALKRRNRQGTKMPPPAEWVPKLWDLHNRTAEPSRALGDDELTLDVLARMVLAREALPEDLADARVEAATRVANTLSLADKRQADLELQRGTHSLKADVVDSFASVYAEVRTVLGDELAFRLRDRPPKGLNDSRELTHELAGRVIAAINRAVEPYRENG